MFIKHSILRRHVRTAFVLVGLPVAILACGVAWRRSTGNLGTVVPGRLFRSAQLDARSLSRFIGSHGIKTVINLRGANPDQAWYRSELAATLGAGAIQIDIPLASDQWLARDQSRAIVDVLDHCEYPALIHCEFGAERTGLVSSLAVLLEEHGSLEEARRQFSWQYLFLPMQDGLVMLNHLRRYEAWLEARRLAHTSALLRQWLESYYKPGTPSREYWPCNPYPLKVVTRPESRGATQSKVEWPGNACPDRVATRSGEPTRR